MGEMLLCSESIVAMPYYIDGVGLNIYSLEELSYYIAVNTYLVDYSFMDEELCDWIGKEVKREQLADLLRKKILDGCRLSEFVECILVDTGYCTKTEIDKIVQITREMENKSDFECHKIRADKLLEKEKFLAAIYEYRNILDSEETSKEETILVGNIWNNLGTAYAKLFLFSEAAKCFKTAYLKNNRQESLESELKAYYCMNDMDSWNQVALHYGIEKEQLQKIEENLKNQQIPETDDSVNDLIYQWKEEYRRISRI